MSGVAHITLLGYNPSASSTAATVWEVGSGSYAQLTTATAGRVQSVIKEQHLEK